MDRQNPYFILSGLLSLSLFTLVLSLFFYMMFKSTTITNFALKKDDYISISLDVVPIPTKQIQKTETIAVEEVQNIQEVKEVDIGNLFSDVWTQDIKKKKVKVKEKKIDTSRFELMLKKSKTSKENTVKPTAEIIKNIEAKTLDTQTKKSSSGDEVNEYLAKIQAIVYKYFEPPLNSGGHTVQVRIELSPIGKVLDFRILTYSSNQALNKECDKIKDRVATVLFPKNPNNVSFNATVNITSDK